MERFPGSESPASVTTPYYNYRSSPPVSYTPYAQYVADATNASESGSSVNNPRRDRRRAGSFGKIWRWHSADSRSQLHSQSVHSIGGSAYRDASPVPPAPAPPPPTNNPSVAAPAVQPPHTTERSGSNPPESGRKRSFSASRVVLVEGRTMLRKISRKASGKGEEDMKLEQERKARLNVPPTLPQHNPLPSISAFGNDQSNNNNGIISSTNPNSNSPPRSPPRVTNFSRPGVAMPASSNINSSSSPAYAIRSAQPSSSPPDSRIKSNGEYVDYMSRTESMTNRGRSSYASSLVGNNVNSPRRIRRRKDPTPFNVLVIGAKNSGKTSFISFLRHSLARTTKGHRASDSDTSGPVTKGSFTSYYLETEMEGERVGLTVWDSVGLEQNLIDLQLREMSVFVESKFEETFAEEQKVVRSPGVQDTHIHCVFLILDPIKLDANVAAASASPAHQKNGVINTAGLDDELELQVLRSLWGKTTVIPIISKADTLTTGHMSFLKRTVWSSIKAARLDPLEALELEDDTLEEESSSDYDEANSSDADSALNNNTPSKTAKTNHKRHSSINASIKSSSADENENPYIPMSILSPDPYDLPPYTIPKAASEPGKLGRRFPWGFADPNNAAHCDFTRLRDSVFLEWRAELRDLSRDKWYENWRTTRLNNVPGGGNKARVRGGVTPVSAVPVGGRHFSDGVPRSVDVGEGKEVVGSVNGGGVVGIRTHEGVYGNA